MGQFDISTWGTAADIISPNVRFCLYAHPYTIVILINDTPGSCE